MKRTQTLKPENLTLTVDRKATDDRKASKVHNRRHFMTKHMADLQKVLLGFDRFVNDTNTMASAFDTTAYPRFNIVKVGDHGYRIEVAVPGWNKKDLDIALHKGVLTIEGTCKQMPAEDENYIYKGLSGKTFTKTFGVSEHVKLDRAYMERGLLCIDLHEEIPEENKPFKVDIL